MTKDLLISAIQLRRVVTLTYQGYTRTVEPHCIGVDKHGVAKLRCFQTSGGSNSGNPVDWKLFIVREIHSASMSEAVFSSARPGYRRGDSAMRRIDAQL